MDAGENDQLTSADENCGNGDEVRREDDDFTILYGFRADPEYGQVMIERPAVGLRFDRPLRRNSGKPS